MTIIERVARAIYGANNDIEDWDVLPATAKALWLRSAEAALNEARKPTEGETN